MSCWYSFAGNVKIRLTEESRALVAELEAALEGKDFDYNLEDVGEEGTITISGGGSMGYSSATEIDAALEALGPFAIEPACFEGECEGEESLIYVGSEEQVKALRSQRATEEILSRSKDLLPADRAKVITELSKPSQESV